MTLNGVLLSVLSLRKSPGGRLWAGMALNQLHPQQLLRMLFTNFRRRGTQNQISFNLPTGSPRWPTRNRSQVRILAKSLAPKIRWAGS